MRHRKLAPWVGLSLALSVALTGCTQSGSKANKEGTVRISIAEPRRLQPGSTTETGGAQVLDALFAPLTDYDRDNKLVLVTAESITSTDNKTWRVKLKPSFTFHNGEKVTADSYVDAWNWAAYAPNAAESATFFAHIEGFAAVNPADPDGDGPLKAPEPTAKTLTGLKKVDELTFDTTLTEPFLPWKDVLAYTAFFPLPKVFYDDPKKFEEAPIGNGPFKMKGVWEHNVKIVTERYDAYPGRKPKVKGVELIITQDQDQAYDTVLNGEVDIIKQVPTTKLGVVEQDFGDRYRHTPAPTFQGIAFPEHVTALKDVRMRKAISMSIDRDAIVKTVFRGSQKAARGWVGPGIEGHRPDPCGETCKFDVAAAKKLFDEAGGVAKLPRVELWYNGDGGHKEWIDATCNFIKNGLGTDCIGKAEPKFADLLNALDARKVQGAFRQGWVADYLNMEDYLTPLYGKGSSSNYTGWYNDEFDRLVREGNAAPNIAEAVKKYQAAEDILARELPVLPLRFGQNNYAHSNKVKNVHINPLFFVDLFEIEVV